jgi:hypothetical protein
MKTLYIFILTIFICSANGFAQSNKMSSKKSSENSDFVVKETENKSNKKVKPAYKSNKMHNSAKAYDKVDNVAVDKSLANAVRVKKANYASSGKYKKNQQAYLNEINSNTRFKSSRSKRHDGKFGF